MQGGPTAIAQWGFRPAWLKHAAARESVRRLGTEVTPAVSAGLSRSYGTRRPIMLRGDRNRFHDCGQPRGVAGPNGTDLSRNSCDERSSPVRSHDRLSTDGLFDSDGVLPDDGVSGLCSGSGSKAVRTVRRFMEARAAYCTKRTGNTI
jgi:hypothetical protein